MLLDDVLDVLAALKERIQIHRQDLQANETRTRMALVDPLLQALGWDTTDPAQVRPEHSVKASKDKVDYALLGPDQHPAIFLEAKKLGEPLESHIEQMVRYANMEGIAYAGLTNGDHWVFYDVFAPRPLDERRMLSVAITQDDLAKCTLKLLLLWRSNLNSQPPEKANSPVLRVTSDPPPDPPAPPPDLLDPPPDPPPVGDWIPLSEFKKGEGRPASIRFPNGETHSIVYWNEILVQTVNWLVTHNLLTLENVPVSSGKVRHIVHSQPLHPTGNDFVAPREIQGLWVESHQNADATLQYAKTLMERCNQDLDQTYLQKSS